MDETETLQLTSRGVGDTHDWDVHITHPEYPGMAVETSYVSVRETTARKRAGKLHADVMANPAHYFITKE